MTFAHPALFSTMEHVLTRDDTAITVTAGGSAHTKGSWVELDASASMDVQAILLVMMRGGNKGDPTLLDIGTGAASSETAHVENLLLGAGAESGGGILIPVDISSGDEDLRTNPDRSGFRGRRH